MNGSARRRLCADELVLQLGMRRAAAASGRKVLVDGWGARRAARHHMATRRPLLASKHTDDRQGSMIDEDFPGPAGFGLI